MSPPLTSVDCLLTNVAFLDKEECALEVRQGVFLSFQTSNYSGTFLETPAAAMEKEGDFAGTPRAPARGLRPPAPPAEELPKQNVAVAFLLRL